MNTRYITKSLSAISVLGLLLVIGRGLDVWNTVFYMRLWETVKSYV